MGAVSPPGRYGRAWGRDQRGLSPSPCGAGSAGEAFLSTIQKAAEVVANAVRPGPESPGTQRSLPRGDAYQPAMTPSTSRGGLVVGKPLSGALPGARGSGETLLGALAFPARVWVRSPSLFSAEGRGTVGREGQDSFSSKSRRLLAQGGSCRDAGEEGSVPCMGSGSPALLVQPRLRGGMLSHAPLAAWRPTEPFTDLVHVYRGLYGGFLVL